MLKKKEKKNCLKRFRTRENLLSLLMKTIKIFSVIPNLYESLPFLFETILLIRLDKTKLVLLKKYIQYLICLIIYFIEYELFWQNA